MNILLILFDGTTIPIDAQENIIAYLRQYPSWARLLPTSWLIKTPKNTAEVRDELIPLARGGKIIVFNVSNSGWGTTFSNEVTDWLKQNK